ncbi:subtilase family protein [Kribbella pratensis]|uniref:Subtilase family protein n=1 Tax=Kribbella pratensis TaxID=2512112 RepID=A0ABY2FHG5_9ACTN|nr:S8 family peptidase [Kribbella pratensis]TDW90518.1 subtilase family protein [Kribbella pratensis]
MAEDLRHLDHLLVIEHAADEGFHRPGGGNPRIRPVERRAHGLALQSQFDQAFREGSQARRDAGLDIEELRAVGTIIVLEGAEASYPLRLDSLTAMSKHRKTPKRPQWLLLSVHAASGDQPERATVWVSDDYRSQFLKLFEDYLDKSSTGGNPRNQALVANIARIRRVLLDDLWTSEGEPPRDGRRWWELWLDTTRPDHENIEGFVRTYDLRLIPRSIVLRDRRVLWIESTWAQLEILPVTKIPIAEIRRPEFVDTIEDLSAVEQGEYVEDLAARLVPAPDHAPAVCHLDSGVNRNHLLLTDSLDEADHHTIIGASGNDLQGHGTSMAGLALFGESLDELLIGNDVVELNHRLESVKMLPAKGEPQHDPRDYGSATVEAVMLPEITARRRRVFCLPVSAPPDRAGEPTLWSATVDALAAGTAVTRDGEDLQLITVPDPDVAKLILVATGNVDSCQADFRTESDTSAVEDPAQAWNVLTVGAHTNLVDVPDDPQYQGWKPQAGAGELSPHSRTSVLFDQRKWPIKPDICMEGGNVLTDGATGFENRHPLLSLRSTGIANDIALTSANATSAATAQAARLAAKAIARYPDYWPETIRGLLTHAADWTPVMRGEIDAAGRKRDKLQLLRRYGWGVPSEGSVLASSGQAVTMVSQDQFVPFEGDELRVRRFRLHTLPWPSDVLLALGEADVRLRVTLSYFIEPSASRRGWRQRYAYASHGLRFDLQGTLETQQEFIQRVNRDAQSEEGNGAGAATTSDRWLVGANQRHLGSLHQDDWYGTGAELARCNSIAVYPVGGWWKNSRRRDRSDLPIRYALLVSLRTSAENVDLYTPIANLLSIPVPIQAE